MDTLIRQKNNRQIATWLLTGVGMIVIQIILGGITRLTESGLSITEWKPITGALPPLNDSAWQIEFEKYRGTDQFKYVHQGFSLQDFKFIFFWEWAHRLWARLMGIVFIIGFIYFLIRRKFSPQFVTPMIILFLLGALQGLVGWLMVKSGLVPEKYFVGHIELTTHFIAALILLSYTLWFALGLLADTKKVYSPGLKNVIVLILIVFFFQLIYGGFMAGLHAAASAPTWPDINGQFMPASFGELSPWLKNLINNQLAVQFIHRTIAYLLIILISAFYFKSLKIKKAPFFKKLRTAIFLLIILQAMLGIFTVLNATNKSSFVALAVAHQFTAMLLVMCLVALVFIVRRKRQH